MTHKGAGQSQFTTASKDHTLPDLKLGQKNFLEAPLNLTSINIKKFKMIVPTAAMMPHPGSHTVFSNVVHRILTSPIGEQHGLLQISQIHV